MADVGLPINLQLFLSSNIRLFVIRNCVGCFWKAYLWRRMQQRVEKVYGSNYQSPWWADDFYLPHGPCKTAPLENKKTFIIQECGGWLGGKGRGELNNVIWRRSVAALCPLCRIPSNVVCIYTPTRKLLRPPFLIPYCVCVYAGCLPTHLYSQVYSMAHTIESGVDWKILMWLSKAHIAIVGSWTFFLKFQELWYIYTIIQKKSKNSLRPSENIHPYSLALDFLFLGSNDSLVRWK